MTIDTAAASVFWWEALTAEQQAKVAQLRAELQRSDALLPEHTALADDASLLRFLKARSWHVDKAAKMYQAMAAWRAEENVDAVLDEQFPELPAVRASYPQFFHKCDRWGRPVWIELLGHIDVEGLLQVTTIDRFLRYHVQTCESFRLHKLPACSAAAGRPILTQTIILDMAGLSPVRHFTQTVLKILAALSAIDQHHFPEHLGCLFMINTPLLFRSFWQVIKTFLDERTLAKIKVLGTSYRSELLAVIPEENLPQMFGGSSAVHAYEDVGPWQDPLVAAAVKKAAVAAGSGSGAAAQQRQQQQLQSKKQHHRAAAATQASSRSGSFIAAAAVGAGGRSGGSGSSSSGSSSSSRSGDEVDADVEVEDADLAISVQ